ncbi:hypothetical protein QBC46DRAFT_434392 [Diplogelasinospora grovesii]|uniref:Uncharacterized protein n=1 Tax=Diplogelasinospora grovesii TaxID=303347 RepID=A0AAN6N7D3_9PEZI|nr:hypothetical protein QBC46DRAFT_434392 [Diplogelasinospora grovesii]
MASSMPGFCERSNDGVAIERAMTDFNFPEMLARDLEASEAVFASKSMTAGPPSPALAMPGHSISRCRSLTARVGPNSLVVIHERASPGQSKGGTEQDLCVPRGGFSDSASDSSSAFAPSIRVRKQSVATAVTSIADRCTSPFYHISLSASSISSQSSSCPSPDGTWFDAKSDPLGDFPPDPESCVNSDKDLLPPRPHSSLGLPRLATTDLSFEFASNPGTRPATATAHRDPSPRNTMQRDQGPLRLPVYGRGRVVDVPRRYSSLSAHRHTAPLDTPHALPEEEEERPSDHCEGHDPDGSTLMTSPTSSLPVLTISCGRTIVDASRPSSMTAPQTGSITGDLIPELDDFNLVGIYPGRPVTPRRRSTLNVKEWLEANEHAAASPGASQPGTRSMAAASIPLPADVLDTLRVSVACFPDTMLLSSSLTIETIRTYSKKIRHEVVIEDNQSSFSFESPGKANKRWSLAGFMHPLRAKHQAANTRANAKAPDSVTVGKSAVTPHWRTVRNIFPSGSDKLCDALYAHIVAYNYLDTILPSAPARATPPRTSYGPSAGTQDSPGKIPKKAASILGLVDEGSAENKNSITNAGSLSLGRAVSRARSTRINNRTSIAAGADDGTAILRNLHSGLARIIGMLIQTLKSTNTSGESSTRARGTALLRAAETDIDPVLMRALCEAVRCSEELHL